MTISTSALGAPSFVCWSRKSNRRTYAPSKLTGGSMQPCHSNLAQPYYGPSNKALWLIFCSPVLGPTPDGPPTSRVRSSAHNAARKSLTGDLPKEYRVEFLRFTG